MVKNNNIIKILKTKYFDIEIKEDLLDYEEKCANTDCSEDEEKVIYTEDIGIDVGYPLEFPLCEWCDDNLIPLREEK